MAQVNRNSARSSSAGPGIGPRLAEPMPDLFGAVSTPMLAQQAAAQRIDDWIDRLARAFEDQKRYTKALPLAEEALTACPGDPNILLFAATAALFAGSADRAQAFLKRFDKRATGPAAELLRALAVHQSGNTVAAKTMLERQNMTRWPDQLRAFPGGFRRARWLQLQLEMIFEPASQTAKHPPVPAAARGKPASNSAQQRRKERTGPVPATAVDAPPSGAPKPAEAIESLPLISFDLEFDLRFDPSRLLSGLRSTLAAAPPDQGRAEISALVSADIDGRWFGLRERLAHLGLVQGFDELLCENQVMGIEPFPHQVETVRKVLRQFHGRVLLADEVGLGKTIEACMVLKEYALRGMAERALILTPASLVGQWREELETKFSLSFATSYDALLRDDPAAFWAQKHVVASIAAARRREHAEHLAAQAYDVVIVDEAHHLKDRSSQSWKLVDALNKRFLLLLSATPVQNDLVELYNLLTLLKPGIFKTPKDFRAVHVTPGKPRVPANPDALRALMRDAMIRNTRAIVALKLPRRQASTLKIEPSAGERAAYAALTAAARDIAAGDASGKHRLALHHLLVAAGSSPRAAAASAQRMAERDPTNKVWSKLARTWAALGRGVKETALMDLLRKNAAEKKIVFVQARETLEHLSALFEEQGIAFARFDGSLSGPEKDAAIAAFREDASVLLCTQSGGEGRNIQFCNTLINFDVPWNPMAIEQRIGRIDRIGQERDVFVFNLVTLGTLEEQVLILLDEKIAMFELVVGEVGAILGGLEEDREFPDLVLEAWLAATEMDRSAAFDAIGQSLTAARDQHDGAKVLDETLFGEDFETA
jgi:superfamily II DNA or RNA helicase